jgi:hypothetical protein
VEYDTLKTIAGFLPIATPFINAMVETRVKPLLQDLFKARNIDKDLLKGMTKFSEYLGRTYQKHSYLNVLVFQNRPKELKKLYVPITLIGQHTVGKLVEESGGRRVVFSNDLIVDSDADDFLPHYRKILVNDTAGMGKSTLLRFLFLQCIEKDIAIPVLIELRRITQENSILKLMSDELNAIDDGFDEEFLLSLIRRGDFVFLFDGFDEIPLSNRDFVTSHVQNFISKTASNYFVLTSRPDPSLASFHDFTGFKIKPLRKDEAYQLIRNYDEDSGQGEKLIQDLESDQRLEEFEAFLSNPLLISLLYAYYEYTPHLPDKRQAFKKHLFYRQVYDALFYRHDLSKPGAQVREKRTHLGLDDFERLLRALAYLTFKSGEIEYDTDTILNRISQVKELCGDLHFNASDLLEDVVLNVPLFAKEGIYYRWQHKSLQEYFAARFILKDVGQNTGKLLVTIYKSPEIERCANLLSLIYDMDANIFRASVGHEIAKDYAEHSSSFLRDQRGNVAEADIIMRRELSFVGSVLFLITARSANRTAAQFVEELRQGNLRWGGGTSSNIFRNVLNDSDVNLNQLKFNVIGIGEHYLETAVLLSRSRYVVLGILAERKDRLVKKLVYADPISALESSLDIFGTDTLYNTSEPHRDGVTSAANKFSATNQIMILALNDQINDSVFDFEQCRMLLELPKINEQTTNVLFTGW